VVVCRTAIRLLWHLLQVFENCYEHESAGLTDDLVVVMVAGCRIPEGMHICAADAQAYALLSTFSPLYPYRQFFARGAKCSWFTLVLLEDSYMRLQMAAERRLGYNCAGCCVGISPCNFAHSRYRMQCVKDVYDRCVTSSA